MCHCSGTVQCSISQTKELAHKEPACSETTQWRRGGDMLRKTVPETSALADYWVRSSTAESWVQCSNERSATTTNCTAQSLLRIFGANVWNDFPSDITSASSLPVFVFRQRIETFLFRLSYPELYLSDTLTCYWRDPRHNAYYSATLNPPSRDVILKRAHQSLLNVQRCLSLRTESVQWSELQDCSWQRVPVSGRSTMTRSNILLFVHKGSHHK